MTTSAKKYIALDKQILSYRAKAEKFETGCYYDRERFEIWANKAAEAQEKQSNMVFTDLDMDDIENYYLCGEMFDRDYERQRFEAQNSNKTTIEKVKQGDYFRLKPASPVYVKGEYNRFAKKYEANKFDDYNANRLFKKGTEVIIGFDF